jgi:hypothetical protein
MHFLELLFIVLKTGINIRWVDDISFEIGDRESFKELEIKKTFLYTSTGPFFRMLTLYGFKKTSDNTFQSPPNFSRVSSLDDIRQIPPNNYMKKELRVTVNKEEELIRLKRKIEKKIKLQQYEELKKEVELLRKEYKEYKEYDDRG